MALGESRRRIGVFSHGGTSNLGDEALLAAVIQNVRVRIPTAEVLGFTINPHDTEHRHGITSFPIRHLQLAKSEDSRNVGVGASNAHPGTSKVRIAQRIKNRLKGVPGLRSFVTALQVVAHNSRSVLAEPIFLVRSFRRLRGVELLLIAGSQQLNDGYGGAWGFPYTLFKWTMLAKLTGTKVAILSVGAGPISSPLSKFFFKRVLNTVSYRSYRDEISSRLMASMGIKGKHPVYPDLVYSLQLPAPRPAPGASERAVVGTNPVPFFDGRYWPTPDPTLYGQYVSKFARFAEWLDQNNRAVLFFPTQVRADKLTIEDIQRDMNGSSHSPNVLRMQPVHNLEDLVSEIARTDFVVANRYHGILISLMMNKPVLGVAYHEKSRALLSQVGQGDYVLNIADFKTEDLISRFCSLQANAQQIKATIAAHMEPLRRALDEQYDSVVGLVGVRSTVRSVGPGI
jgi:polysaccharide pyruvyl transferase WcaK-like protein